MKTQTINRMIVAALVIASVACGKDDKAPVKKDDSKDLKPKQEEVLKPSAEFTSCDEDLGFNDACEVKVQLPYQFGEEERMGVYTLRMDQDEQGAMKPSKEDEKTGAFIFAEELGDFEVLLVSAYSSEMSQTGTVYVFSQPEDSKEKAGKLELVATVEDTTRSNISEMIKDTAGEDGSVQDSARMLMSTIEKQNKEKAESGENDSGEETEQNQDDNNADVEEDSEQEAEPKAEQPEVEVEEDVD